MKLILASRSPRRNELLTAAGFKFKVRSADIDETPPAGMPVKKVPQFLAEKKAKAIKLSHNEMVIAADTLVLLNNKIFGKPTDKKDAERILKALSGNMHTVVTGVCIMTSKKTISFSEQTKVFFRALTKNEIDFYIGTYKPFDKAGAYAIQEWIGIIGIYRIEGDYFNVMGLPVCRLVEEMKKFNLKIK
jgi:septum formation protein